MFRAQLFRTHFATWKVNLRDAQQFQRQIAIAYAHSAMKLCHYSIRTWKRRIAYWNAKGMKQLKADQNFARAIIRRWRLNLAFERKMKGATREGSEIGKRGREARERSECEL